MICFLVSPLQACGGDSAAIKKALENTWVHNLAGDHAIKYAVRRFRGCNCRNGALTTTTCFTKDDLHAALSVHLPATPDDFPEFLADLEDAKEERLSVGAADETSSGLVKREGVRFDCNYVCMFGMHVIIRHVNIHWNL